MVINAMVKAYLESRLRRIQTAADRAPEIQQQVWTELLTQGKDTVFGNHHRFERIRSYEDFNLRVPIRSYEELFPYIQRTMRGEKDVLWPGTVRWFAKSSGTTNDRSKFIPVTKESLEECHYKGGRDVLSIYTKHYPDHQLFEGKSLVLTGSVHQDEATQAQTGDVSAVLIENMPFWMHFFRTPAREIAFLPNWEEKLSKLVEATIHEDVTFLSGVPSWMLSVLQKALEITGHKDIRSVWPNLQLFIHGAVRFDPYRPHYKRIIPHEDMHYLETYNASEGFFGIQDLKEPGEMLLMTDYGVFYEFIPTNELHLEKPKAIPLEEVELGVNYAMVISTSGGLWRYMIGDTLKFSSTAPFRFHITGRTKHFINAFGEELMVDNAEMALAEACKQTRAVINEYTAAPLFFEQDGTGCHEWIIEFSQAPENPKSFAQIFDNRLKALNSDYEAKRKADLTLKFPRIYMAPEGTFYTWMKQRGKTGGQNKVPRLSNDRQYIDSISTLCPWEPISI